MELKIIRQYFTHGTNGDLFVNGQKYCHTIELPYLNNQHEISCIPEGCYKLVKHHSDHLGNVIMLLDVPFRYMIYIHPANDAQRELKGCIAPVTFITGEGKGSLSKPEFTPLRDKIYGAIDKTEECYIIIESIHASAIVDNAPIPKSYS